MSKVGFKHSAGQGFNEHSVNNFYEIIPFTELIFLKYMHACSLNEFLLITLQC